MIGNQRTCQLIICLVLYTIIDMPFTHNNLYYYIQFYTPQYMQASTLLHYNGEYAMLCLSKRQ